MDIPGFSTPSKSYAGQPAWKTTWMLCEISFSNPLTARFTRVILPNMRSANYFRVGSRVIANSLFGPKILGIYKGSRGSFGVIIYGRPLGSEETEVDHVCSKLSMELYKLPKPPGSLTKDKLKIKAGDQVTGSNYMGLIIKGSYMNRDGKYAWIKGWSEKDSRLEHPKVYRILSSTLLKL